MTEISPETNEVDKRGHKARERRCVASGDITSPDIMVRFVKSPDGDVTPDIFSKLPGRGVWVTANRKSLTQAIKKKAFNHGFKSQVNASDNLVDLVAKGLEHRMLGLISMAMKSGQLIVGFDQVRAAATSGPLAWRIEASDGSANSRSKIRVLTKAMSHELDRKDTPVIGCFTSKALGKALGRDHIVHAAIMPGSMARALSDAATRLAGFIALIPSDWPDQEHETVFSPEIKGFES